MRLNFGTILLGSFLAFALGLVATVILPLVDPVMNLPGPSTRRYDALALKGRQVYIQNGCIYCHSQYVRPVAADRGLGPVSKPADYANDQPHLMGSTRNGPDLMHVGSRIPDANWHREHLKAPRQVVPGSTMPPYAYLSEAEMEALVAYLLSLKSGVRP